MLDKGDLEKINKLFFDNFNRIWEDNVEPVMATKSELRELEVELRSKPSIEHIDTRFEYLEKKMHESAVGPSIARDRVLNKKGDEIALKLQNKEVFDTHDVTDIEVISPVSKI